MNNWRLLLLALFAVVQPIASFTERNFDGRHQCAQSRPSLQDSRVPLYGTDRFAKTTEERRLRQRDEIREDRRHEIKQNGPASRTLSSDSSLLRTRDGDTREVTPRSEAAKSRREYRLERISNDRNRRILPIKENQIVRNTRGIQREEHNRRVVREYRSQNERVSESSHLSRDVSRTKHVNERRSEYSPDSRHETQRFQIRSQELRRDSPNRDSRNVLRRTRDDVARIHEDASVESNRQQFRDRLDVARRERSVSVEVRRSFDNNNARRISERRTSINEDRRLLSPDTQAVNEVRHVRDRFNSRKEIRGNADAPLTRTARFEDNREFKDGTNYLRRLTRDMMQINEETFRKSPRITRATANNNIQLERNSENRKEMRNDERRFTDNERMRTNRREVRNYGRHSKQRITDNRREIRNNVRDVRDESIKEVRNNERRIKEKREVRISENRRVSDDENRSPEKNSKSRGEIRNSEAIRYSRRETRDEETGFRGRNSGIQREIRSADRINEVRDNKRRVRESHIERRREIRSAEAINDIRENEKRVRERHSQTRREIRSPERIVENRREIRNDERRFSDANNENRKQMNIRDKERRVRERNNEVRREIRSAERMNDIRHNERSVNERNSESRREMIRSETIREIQRETRDNERRFRENRYNDQRSIQNRNEIRNTRREIRDDERRSRSRDTESRMETRKDSEMKVRDNQDLRRKVRNDERRFHEIRFSRISGNEREVRNSNDFRDIRSTSGRRFDTRTGSALERDNLAINRRARSIELGSIRDNTAKTRATRSDERDVSRMRTKFLKNDKTMDKEKVDTRNQSDESARNRKNSVSVIQSDNESVDESVIANWQYVFYTLQGIYFCGLLMQVLTPKESEKFKTRNWWHFKSQRLIKVD